LCSRRCPPDLPSDLIERRPDIRQAEQDLIAANARIGVAQGGLLPEHFLTGLFGVGSADLSKLFTGPGSNVELGGAITVPIFTAGAISGQVKTTEAIQKNHSYDTNK